MAPKIQNTVLFFVILSAMVVSRSSAYAEEESAGVKAAGVVHNIAPDRKVEKIGGVMQPEPLDLYIKRLIDHLSEQISQLDQKLDRVASRLNPPVQTPQFSAAPAGKQTPNLKINSQPTRKTTSSR